MLAGELNRNSKAAAIIEAPVSDRSTEWKNWWKELALAFVGPIVVVFSIQLGWVVAAVVGVVILIAGVAIFAYDLGRRQVTIPEERRERVLETVAEVDEGEDYEIVSYYFEKGDRILVEADSRVHGKRFSLLVLHQSDLSAYKKNEGPYTLVSVENTVLHRERFEIPGEGYWHFIIEPEWSENVSVELSVWKLK